MSLKDDILAAADTKLEPIQIPEWNVTVYVPVSTLGEAEELQKITSSDDGSFVRLAAFIIRDEAGNKLFSEADLPDFAKKSLPAIRRIVDVYNRINGNEDAAKN